MIKSNDFSFLLSLNEDELISFIEKYGESNKLIQKLAALDFKKVEQISCSKPTCEKFIK